MPKLARTGLISFKGWNPVVMLQDRPGWLVMAFAGYFISRTGLSDCELDVFGLVLVPECLNDYKYFIQRFRFGCEVFRKFIDIYKAHGINPNFFFLFMTH